MGRRRKQKKQGTTNSAAEGSTPAVSRAPSPEPTVRKEKNETIEAVAQAEVKVTPAEPDVVSRVSPTKPQENKSKGKGKNQRQPSPEPVPPISEPEEEFASKPMSTPASVFKELRDHGLVDDSSSSAFLKSPSVNYRHPDPLTENPSFNPKLTVSAEDRTMLLQGQPVHKLVEGVRTMLTPNGDCVRCLTKEEEQRYLSLQERIAEQSGATAFTSARHGPGSGFNLIEGRAVPSGPPSFFPTPSPNTIPIDPVSKINRGEALGYINQYVLPTISGSMQLEQALNNNALDTQMVRAGSVAAWNSWSESPTAHFEHPDTAYGAANREGMIATGLESMTAQFTLGNHDPRSQTSAVSLLSLSDSETAMQHARKEADILEKRLTALIKKNKRILLGSSH